MRSAAELTHSWKVPLLLAGAALLYVALGAGGWHDRLRWSRGGAFRWSHAVGNTGSAADAATMAAQIDQLSAENARLRQLLKLPRSGWKMSQTASCLSRDGDRFYADLWLDRGSEEGVTTNTVGLHGSGLVGRVVEVSAHQCRLRSCLHPASRVPVALGRDGLQGVAHGDGWSLQVEGVRPRPQVPDGALVTTSGLGTVYPPGVLVGLVRRTLPAPEPLFANYEVEPSVLLDQVLEVLLVERGGR